jgi:hypothetical protein
MVTAANPVVSFKHLALRAVGRHQYKRRYGSV